jgi:hypothetical protein
MRITLLIIMMAASLAGCTAAPGANPGAGERSIPGAGSPPGTSSSPPTSGGTAGTDRNADERFVRPGQPRVSPSGKFVAHAEPGPEPAGEPTWIVVITDREGRELFRDTEAYRSRPGVGITWLTDTDELWLLSTDTGLSYLQPDEDDIWSKERPRPDHHDQDVPAEIRQLAGR